MRVINTARLVCMLMVASAASRGHQMIKMPVGLSIISSSLFFPLNTSTSIAILCNPKMGLHRDLMNFNAPAEAFELKMKTEMRLKKCK